MTDQDTVEVNPTDTGWTRWGIIHDRQATLGVVKALQAEGKTVRVVSDDTRNIIWMRG